MPREIERKFLLKSDAWRVLAHRTQPMRQGYLASSTRTSVRVRIAGDEAWLNIKSGDLVATAMDGGSAASAGSILRPSRQEYEYSIPIDEAGELLALSDRPLIEKTRYLVVHAGKTWEIDEFHGDNAGLVVAELELEREDEEFQHPPWLGLEVTRLRRYYNVCLATHPYRAWTEAERNP